MALQDVRFDDLIAKLDEFDRFYCLWHELSFVELKPVNSTWDLHVDCERARRTIRELLPADMMVLNCSSAASDCLIELKEVIDRFDWTIDGSGVEKLRKMLQRLLQLGPQGRALSADHLKEPTSAPNAPAGLANESIKQIAEVEIEAASAELRKQARSQSPVALVATTPVIQPSTENTGDEEQFSRYSDPLTALGKRILKSLWTHRFAVQFDTLRAEAWEGSEISDSGIERRLQDIEARWYEAGFEDIDLEISVASTSVKLVKPLAKMGDKKGDN